MMKKGFFFVITVFLILGYIMTSISIWVKVTNEAEKQYAERLRISNIEFVIREINPGRMKEMADKTAFFSLFELNEHVGSGNFIKDRAGDEFFHFREVMKELIVNGTANESHFLTGVPLSINPQNFSLNNFVNKLNLSLSNVGMKISEYKVGGFNISQASLTSFNYSLLFNITVVDTAGSMQLKRNYNITSNISFAGFVDPLILNKGQEVIGNSIEREYYFFDAYDNPDSLRPGTLAQRGTEGQEWFYGPVISADRAGDVAPENRSKFILVGTYDEIKTPTDAAFGEFGAYLLTSSPDEYELECSPVSSLTVQLHTLNPITREDESNCDPDIKTTGSDYTESPFAVVPGFSIATIPNDANYQCPEDPTNKCILFVNRFSFEDVISNPDNKRSAETSLYGIEKLRDFALCGYFINNPAGPSYPQRLLINGYERQDPEFGIDTFLVGEYVYQNTPDIDNLGKVDKELFTNENGDKIRGMPGCRNAQLCSDDTLLTGHFSLGDNYGQVHYTDTSVIACDDGRADCE